MQDKQTTLLTPDPAECNMNLGIELNDTTLEKENFPKILSVRKISQNIVCNY